MNIILTGFRGSGKTTVGRELAKRIGFSFVDTDGEVEQKAGKTIARIFESGGEACFRQLEEETVISACGLQRHVIALGGGALKNPALAPVVRKAGAVIFLSAPADVLYERTSGDRATASRRPALTPAGGLAEVKELLTERLPLYRQTAELTVDTASLAPEAVAAQIEAQLRCGKLAGRFSGI